MIANFSLVITEVLTMAFVRFVTRMKAAHSFVALYSRTLLFTHKQGLLSLRSLTTLSSTADRDDTTKAKPFSNIPGPLRLPVIGTVWTFFVGAKGQPPEKRFLDLQAENVKKYGKIVREQRPGMEVVSIADPGDVAKLLRSEPKYPQRLEDAILDYYPEKRKKIPGVFFADGEEWYKLRSALSKRMLRPKEVADFAPSFNVIVTDFIHRIRSLREPSGSEKENEVCELDNELFKWSFESVTEMLFDKRFGCLEADVNEEAQTFIKAVG